MSCLAAAYQWAVSDEGAAVGTWLASGAGVIALWIAVRAYLNDKQHAREQRDREWAAQRNAYGRFIDNAGTIIHRASGHIEVTAKAAATKPIDAYGMLGDEIGALRRELPPIAEALDGLRFISPADAELVILLGQAASSVRSALPQTIAAASASHIRNIMLEAIAALEAVGTEIRNRHPNNNSADW